MFGYRRVSSVPYSGIHMGGWKREKHVTLCVMEEKEGAAREPRVKKIGEAKEIHG